MPWHPNPGRCPDECLVLDELGEVTGYRRVHVWLFNGSESSIQSPNGWASGGRGGCNWSICKPPHPFDIQEWRLI